MARAVLSKSIRLWVRILPRGLNMIMINEKSNWQFGKCPVCRAIVSLDSSCNVLCDACYVGRGQDAVIMPTKEDLDNGFNPFKGNDETYGRQELR